MSGGEDCSGQAKWKMSISLIRRVASILGCFLLLFIAACGWLVWAYDWMPIRVALADEQTRYYDSMRVQALESVEPSFIAGRLANAVGYYPSGTKQAAGSRLD